MSETKFHTHNSGNGYKILMSIMGRRRGTELIYLEKVGI
jgi:hypothetical protein